MSRESPGGPILFLGCVPFAAIRQRPQHLALELSRHGEVLYVEPHRSFLRAPLFRGAASPALEPPRAAPAAAPERLDLLTPRPMLPFSGYFPVANRLNCARTAGRIRRRIEERGWRAPRAIIAGFPKHADLVRFFPDIPVCYDVMDEYASFFDLWQGAVIARLHHRLLRRADVVLAASEVLADRCRGAARRIVRVSNGVSPAFHEACARAPADPSLLALPAPRLGYVGTIGRWIDFEVLRILARSFPGGSVVVIGPFDGRRPLLPANVRFLGERPHGALPAILRTLDAGLVPFRRSRLTDAVNPVKVYEYLSAGLPVLSSDFAGIREFGSLVSVCRCPDEWVEEARRARHRKEPSEVEERRSFAARHLWPERALEILRAIEEVERGRG